jgi:hypothetical protein
MRSSIISILIFLYFYADEVEENGVNGRCSMYRGDGTQVIAFI